MDHAGMEQHCRRGAVSFFAGVVAITAASCGTSTPNAVDGGPTRDAASDQGAGSSRGDAAPPQDATTDQETTGEDAAPPALDGAAAAVCSTESTAGCADG